jgi:hypothetical protein
VVIFSILKQKKYCPTQLDLMGRGCYFLHLPGQVFEEPRSFYKLVKSIIEGDVSGSDFDKELKKEPKYRDISYLTELLLNPKESLFNRYRAMFTLRELNTVESCVAIC